MRRRQKGASLVLTLAVLASVVAMVAGFAANQRAAMRQFQLDVDRERARRVALAAVERAIAEIALADENQVTLSDEWALLGEPGGQRFQIGPGFARIQVLDEGAFVDLNSADQQQLLNLGLTTEQADSLMDWREPGQEPRPEGAKDEFYNALPEPYNAALRPLRSLDELMLIKGFIPRDLYEVPEERNSNQVLVSGDADAQPVLINLATVWSRAPWTGANNQPRLNVNTATAQQLVQRGIPFQTAAAIIQRRNAQGTFSRLGQLFEVPTVTLATAAVILDNLSVDNATQVTGRLNLNTASEAALNSIPDMTPDMTSAILSRQETGFTSLGELASVPGVSLPFLQQHADRFVLGSRAFRVRVIGSYGGAAVPLEAVVRLEGGAPRVVASFEQPYSDMAARWQWSAEPSTDIVLAEDE